MVTPNSSTTCTGFDGIFATGVFTKSLLLCGGAVGGDSESAGLLELVEFRFRLSINGKGGGVTGVTGPADPAAISSRSSCSKSSSMPHAEALCLASAISIPVSSCSSSSHSK